MLFNSNNFSPGNDVLAMYFEIHACWVSTQVIMAIMYNTHTWIDFRIQDENEHIEHFVIIMEQYCLKTKKLNRALLKKATA